VVPAVVAAAAAIVAAVVPAAVLPGVLGRAVSVSAAGASAAAAVLPAVPLESGLVPPARFLVFCTSSGKVSFSCVLRRRELLLRTSSSKKSFPFLASSSNTSSLLDSSHKESFSQCFLCQGKLLFLASSSKEYSLFHAFLLVHAVPSFLMEENLFSLHYRSFSGQIVFASFPAMSNPQTRE
jgi:hypothetical protein